jgi:hypothetical protein
MMPIDHDNFEEFINSMKGVHPPNLLIFRTQHGEEHKAYEITMDLTCIRRIVPPAQLTPF